MKEMICLGKLGVDRNAMYPSKACYSEWPVSAFKTLLFYMLRIIQRKAHLFPPGVIAHVM
jgi:hypothetical protein